MSEHDKAVAEEQETASKTDNKTEQEAPVQEENKEEVKEEKKPTKKRKSSSRAKKKEEELKEKLEEKTIEMAELNDKYLRLYSEFDNYRKRTMKEKAELYGTAAESTILAMLPIVDDFERALKSIDDSEGAAAHGEGMALIYNKLLSILKAKGVEAINENEVDFDTDIHEAITKIPAPTKKLRDKVVDVIEKGYKLNGKVIRFAKVVIGE